MTRLKALEKLWAAVCFAVGVAAFLILTSVEARADGAGDAKLSLQTRGIPGSQLLSDLTNL
jgi:hypothetical protein